MDIFTLGKGFELVTTEIGVYKQTYTIGSFRSPTPWLSGLSQSDEGY